MKAKTACLLLLGAIVSLCVGCVSSSSAPPAQTGSELVVLAPAEGAVVPLLSDGQKAFFDLPSIERRKRFRDPVWRRSLAALGHRPQPVRLAWDWQARSDPPGNYAVKLERKGLGATNEYETVAEFRVAVPWFDLTNLEAGREYRWTVSGSGRSTTGTFATEARAPRLLDVPGIPNARDIGGWVGLDGRRVRQGLVFRTAGLNDNAREEWYTPEEVEALDTNGVIAAASAPYAKEAEALRALQAKPGDIAFAHASAVGPWTLFRVAETNFDEAALAALAEIPQTFCGAAAETLPEDGTIGRPGEAAGPAVLLLAFDSEDDGRILVSCGADWWWSLRANGEMVADYILHDIGNDRWPVGPKNHPLLVPVRKGRNLLAVVVKTGTAGWAWHFDPAPAVPPADALADMVKIAERHRDRFYHVRKAVIPGANRVTPETRALLYDRFGIRTDIDLRSDGECRGMEGSPLGEGVRWEHHSSAAYADMQLDWGKDAFREVFRVFLDPEAYGIDFHCIAGQDRTGAVSFIVLGLLGVSEADLRRDWETTALWNPFCDFNLESRFDKLVRGFDKWPGKTVNERIEAYVLSLGFTPEDIAALRERLLEP